MTPENLFQAAVLRLSTPFPSETSPEELAAQEPELARQVAYYDEKLDYVVSLTLPPGALLPEQDDPEGEREALERFLDLVQITTSATFVPRLPPPSAPGPSKSNKNLATPSLSAPPGSTALLSPRLPPTATDSLSIIPPNTPNPMPSMDAELADVRHRYAGVEGVVVWEGMPDSAESEGPDESLQRRRRRKGPEPAVILRGCDGDDWAWRVVWRGQVPIAYLRTPVQNPLLALTASLTLRPPHLARTHRHTNTVSSIGSLSFKSETDDGEHDADDETALAEMEEVDLLDGLAEEMLPSTRLPRLMRQALALPPVTPTSAAPTAAYTPQSAPEPPSAESGSTNANRAFAVVPPQPSSVNPTTLRKSFRTILGLSSGLRVRMRTVILPQLLPLDSVDDDDDDAEAERRIVLCVEVESGLGREDGEADCYEIERVEVDVGGKGGKVEVEMVGLANVSQTFPLRLGRVDQYNLLYALSPAANNDVNDGSVFNHGHGDLQRPVSITVIGRPYHADAEESRRYPSAPFSSKWNCTLDLSTFHQAISVATTLSTVSAGRLSGRVPSVSASPNHIVGDKRYSLASLMSSGDGNNSPRAQAVPKSARTVSGRGPVSAYGNMQPLPPSINASAQDRGQSTLDGYSDVDGEGLLVSVRLLPQSKTSADATQPGYFDLPSTLDAASGTVRALEPFTIEIFVHNQTDEVRRLRIGAPAVETRRNAHQAGGIWAIKPNSNGFKASDAALREQYLNYLDSAPALVPLENDLRCGPLYPHTSQSARMRFMALRDGVHRIEKLHIVGVGPGDEFEYIMSPVIDVIVGDGTS